MKVFISWSGSLAKSVAQLLDSWLPDVIQGAQTWISADDIDKGSIWFGDINEALKSTTVGILCVTRENKEAPWLLFEAGALSKGLTKSRVCPLLIDLSTKDVLPPLSLFNLTIPDKEDMWKLVRTINSSDPENALPEERLKKAYGIWWPEFEKGLVDIRAKQKFAAPVPVRAPEDMIAEILETTRSIQRNMEKMTPSFSGPISPSKSVWESYVPPSVLWEAKVPLSKKSESKFALSPTDILEILKNLEQKEGEKKPTKQAEPEPPLPDPSSPKKKPK